MKVEEKSVYCIFDVCTLTRDNDGIQDIDDNCPDSPNADQLDTDYDGRGE